MTKKSKKAPIRKPKDDGTHGAISVGLRPPGDPIYQMGVLIIGRPAKKMDN